MKVKVGDNVKILAGKDRGKEGRIIKTLKKVKKLPYLPRVVENKQLFCAFTHFFVHVRLKTGKKSTISRKGEAI